jgi:hypothetical protein
VGLLRRTEHGLGRQDDGSDSEAQQRPGEVMGVVVERSRTYTQRPPLYDDIFRVSIRRATQIQDADTSLAVKARRFLRGEHPSKNSTHVQRSPVSVCSSACPGKSRFAVSGRWSWELYVALSKMASEYYDGGCDTVQQGKEHSLSQC